MAEPRAAIQLIVFGERNQTDFAGVLRDVSAAGFSAFEAANLYAAHGEVKVRALIEEHGLTVCGAHFGYGEYADSAKLEAHIAYCRAADVRHMMCSGVADRKSIAGYRESARLFNDVGARLREEGLQFNYHNHAWEFEDLGGATGMEILANETDPTLVKFNIDVYWVWFGGVCPVEFIHAHSARAGYFHFKDGRRGEGGEPVFLELGAGDVDLPACVEAARKVGASWIVAEQDRTELPHIESARISRAYLRNPLGF